MSGDPGPTGEQRSRRLPRLPDPRRLALLDGVGLVGIVTLLTGLVVAWRSKAATPLLVVGAVLVVVRAVDWERIVLRHNDSSMEIQRAKRAQEAEAAEAMATELDEVAADIDLPEDVRRRLAEVERALRAAANAAATDAAQVERELARDARARGGVDYSASHEFLPTGRIALRFRCPNPDYPRLAVLVTRPDGNVDSHLLDNDRGLLVGSDVLYPFHNVDIAPAGRYLVKWCAAAPFTRWENDHPMPVVTRELVTDDFELHEDLFDTPAGTFRGAPSERPCPEPEGPPAVAEGNT